MVHDSCVALGESIIKGAEIVLDLKAGLATADIVVIGCAHKEYSAKGLIENSCSNIRYVYDGRNCLDAENIRSQNILYKGVGR